MSKDGNDIRQVFGQPQISRKLGSVQRRGGETFRGYGSPGEVRRGEKIWGGEKRRPGEERSGQHRKGEENILLESRREDRRGEQKKNNALYHV